MVAGLIQIEPDGNRYAISGLEYNNRRIFFTRHQKITSNKGK
jgi:hypothetical protein